MSKLEFSSIQMENGTILDGNKIGELVKEIINKLSDANLTCDEGKIVLSETERVLGGYTTINKVK